MVDDIQKLVNVNDFETYAQKVLSVQVFEHLKGRSLTRPEDNLTDFNNIRLNARGLLNMKSFKGLAATVCGQQVNVPIGIGPFPALADVKLALDAKDDELDQKACAAVKQVADKQGMLSVIPIEQVREVLRALDSAKTKPFFLYVVPDQATWEKQLRVIKHVKDQVGAKLAGLVLQCGYLPSMAHIDERNRLDMPQRCLKNSPVPPTSCTFKFAMVKQAKDALGLPVVVRGISTAQDALKAAAMGASAVWVTEQNHFRSASSPISILSGISSALKASEYASTEVWLQGGVRRGTDVLKALALGASAVFADEDSVLFGIVKNGDSTGLEALTSYLRDETQLAMVLTHSTQISEVTADRVIAYVQAKPHQYRFKL